MERTFQLIIFISILFTILFFMHLYSFFRFSSLINLDRKAWHYVILVVLASSLIISTILCRVSYNPITKGLYILAACWFGAIFIIFSFLLFFEIPRFLFNLHGPTAGKAVIACIATLVIASIINAQFIRIRTIEMPSFGKEMRAVVLSDIHIGTIWGKNHLEKIVEKANSLKPDVIFILGDVVSGGAIVQKDVLAPLADLQAETFFVHGNHEHYEGIERIERALEGTGIRILKDQEIEFEGIEIAGLNYSEARGHASSVLNTMNISEDKPTILLSHAPIDPKDDRISLILSGHTHAGQIFPFHFVVGLRYPFTSGLHTSGNAMVYVTPGTGTWGPPMRLGSRNEITLLSLQE